MKVMSVFGTRPEAIKMCPLVKELEKNSEIESIVCLRVGTFAVCFSYGLLCLFFWSRKRIFRIPTTRCVNSAENSSRAVFKFARNV